MGDVGVGPALVGVCFEVVMVVVVVAVAVAAVVGGGSTLELLLLLLPASFGWVVGSAGFSRAFGSRLLGNFPSLVVANEQWRTTVGVR